eukprot:CAMPEP_0116823504 /NCGR_PEP_ID=MMETSP0418-20121206/875_1 /TAXON_ID=1158023 /ORGANISM="Astrosyne radiata, Strain 13vi08-1A" /LENGTH=1063 /DNA_ID=CAMNT_0004451765 /DNA_START=1006 /DNA_END=4194 /DNA_ORIENTATION=-
MPSIFFQVPAPRSTAQSSSVADSTAVRLGPFVSATGECVSFLQSSEGWYADTSQGKLCVQSRADLGVYLRWLQGQDAWTSRLRIHLLRSVDPPYRPCVYVGKEGGLLGGMEQRKKKSLSSSRSLEAEEVSELRWVTGPKLSLSGVKRETVVCHIPEDELFENYRTDTWRLREPSSCSIAYVNANSRYEIDRLSTITDKQELRAALQANVFKVVELGSLGAEAGRDQDRQDRSAVSAQHKHAALVLHASTERGRFRSGRVDVSTSICLRRRPQISPHPTPPLVPAHPVVPSPLYQEGTQPSAPSASTAAPLKAEDTQPSSPPTQATIPSPPTQAAVSPSTPARPPAQVPVSPSSHAPSPTDPSVPSGTSSPQPTPSSADDAPGDIDLNVPIEEYCPLISKKLKDPHCVLSESESIELLTACVAYGAKNAEKAKGKEAVIVLGNTGAGKSTFINYLMGCDMIKKSPKELGKKGLGKLVVVKPVSEGGRLNEVMPIGHDKVSKTFMPQIEVNPTKSGVVYCDCPGFLDNRGSEINISNAVNIKRVLQQAKSVKILVLINYHALRADRGRGLSDMLKICTQLFGSSANLARSKDALLLGITQVPSEEADLSALQDWLVEDTPEIMHVLSERLFLYDPLDCQAGDYCDRGQCTTHLSALRGLTHAGRMFQTVLTESDECKLLEIVEKLGGSMRKSLEESDYKSAALRWSELQRLRVIDNAFVERMLGQSQLRLRDKFAQLSSKYREHCVYENFVGADTLWSSLESVGNHFSAEDHGLDLGDLSSVYQVSWQRYNDRLARERKQAQEMTKTRKEIKRLFALLSEQEAEKEVELDRIYKAHAAHMSSIEEAMRTQAASYDSALQQLRSETAEQLRKKDAELSENVALSSEQRAQLEREKQALEASYQAKLRLAEREKLASQKEHEALLAQHEASHQAAASKLAADLRELQSKKQQASEEARRRQSSSPTMAFGASAWKEYIGDVGAEPPLPANIDEILDGPCPFWEGKRVRDTHILTMIPSHVNGQSFSLDLLGELIEHPLTGPATKYGYYYSAVKSNYGTQSPDHSYWV